MKAFRLDGPATPEIPAYAYPIPVYRYDLVVAETGEPFHAMLLTKAQAETLEYQLNLGKHAIDSKGKP